MLISIASRSSITAIILFSISMIYFNLDSIMQRINIRASKKLVFIIRIFILIAVFIFIAIADFYNIIENTNRDWDFMINIPIFLK